MIGGQTRGQVQAGIGADNRDPHQQHPKRSEQQYLGRADQHSLALIMLFMEVVDVQPVDAWLESTAMGSAASSSKRNLPDAEALSRTASAAVGRARSPAVRKRKPLRGREQPPEDPAAVLKRAVGEPRDRWLLKRLNKAARDFEAERFTEAHKQLQPVVSEAPELVDARELMGMALYRLGRWKEAVEQLEKFRELTSSTEQHPVLADCHRALGRWADVEELWVELGQESPRPEIVTEGRIVLAGAKADRGDLPGAIATLEHRWKRSKHPRPDQLRRAYALADLYDRAGKTTRARELFKWVAHHDSALADVTARVRALS